MTFHFYYELRILVQFSYAKFIPQLLHSFKKGLGNINNNYIPINAFFFRPFRNTHHPTILRTLVQELLLNGFQIRSRISIPLLPAPSLQHLMEHSDSNQFGRLSVSTGID
jgi:hypothetical protein